MVVIKSNSLVYWTMMYATPHILRLLASVDFLNNNVQRVDGKLPFYDDETPTMQVRGRKGQMPAVRKRPSIHLKDSWDMKFTAHESTNSATIRLSNSKRDSSGKWVIADLLWYGTSTYRTDVPDIRLTIPVFFKETVYSAVPGVGQTQAGKRRLKDYRTQLLQKGHHTGAMTYYDRYRGVTYYDRRMRHGIRNELVTSWKQYILLCVETGIRIAVDEMTREGTLKREIVGIHVRVK